MLDMKLENKQNPSILFLATYWNLSLNNNGNLEKKFFEIWRILAIFSMEILCIGRNHIFQVEIWRDFAKKKKTTLLRTHEMLTELPAKLGQFDFLSLPSSSALQEGRLCALLVQEGIPLLPRRRISECFGDRERI
jgi:hypothetical protein